MTAPTWRRIYYDHREEFSQKQKEEIFARACRHPDGTPGGPDNLHCEGCGKHLREGDAYEFHHDKGCNEGGRAEIENGKLLCLKVCHRKETTEQAGRRAKADRQHKAAIGLKKKPRRPFPGGRRDKFGKTVDGTIYNRETGEVIREGRRI